MATLSLRRWAQPHVEAKLGRCVLLDRSPGVVIAVDESGIVAVVLDAGTATETNIASGNKGESNNKISTATQAGASQMIVLAHLAREAHFAASTIVANEKSSVETLVAETLRCKIACARNL